MQFVLLCMLPLCAGRCCLTCRSMRRCPTRRWRRTRWRWARGEQADDTTVGEGSPLQFAFAKVRTRSVIVPPPSPLPSLRLAREGSAPSSCSARTSSGGRTARANSASTSSRGAAPPTARAAASGQARHAWVAACFFLDVLYFVFLCCAPPRRARDTSRERRLQADRRQPGRRPFFMTALWTFSGPMLFGLFPPLATPNPYLSIGPGRPLEEKSVRTAESVGPSLSRDRRAWRVACGAAMISSVLFVNQKGEVIISRHYRDGYSKQIAETFRAQVLGSKEVRGGTHSTLPSSPGRRRAAALCRAFVRPRRAHTL